MSSTKNTTLLENDNLQYDTKKKVRKKERCFVYSLSNQKISSIHWDGKHHNLTDFMTSHTTLEKHYFKGNF